MLILFNAGAAYTTVVATLLILIVIVIYINSKIKSSNRKTNKAIKKFLDDERDANFSRSNELSEDFFVTTNLKELPIFENSYLKENFDEANRYIITNLQNKLIRLSSRKLIHILKPISNIDIKRQYGVHNLNLFIEYEQNCTEYLATLREISKIYMNLKLYDIAEKFLLECKRIGSLSSTTYILLAQIYYETNQHSELQNLKNYIETNTIFENNVLCKNKALNYINSLN